MSLEDAALWATVLGGLSVAGAVARGALHAAAAYHRREKQRLGDTSLRVLLEGKLTVWRRIRGRWRFFVATGRFGHRRVRQ